MPKTKLQKQLSRKTSKKKYPKYAIVIPPKQIERLRWKGGDELKEEVNGDKLIIKRKKANP